MIVIRLGPRDAEAVRDIRSEALRLHPTAFSADPDIEKKLTLDDWRGRLGASVWFGSIVDGALCAMVVFRTETSGKTKHTGHLGAMYVREAARGTGLADQLIEAILAHASHSVEQILLAVEAENVRAIKLYERHGFRTIGRIPRAILVDGRYYDELQMFRAVSVNA